jgi:hypothetical protein
MSEVELHLKFYYMPDQKNKPPTEKDNKGLKPDPETLHTTDPQEHMKGPVSSSVQTVKKEVEKDDKESKAEADKKKNENL